MKPTNAKIIVKPSADIKSEWKKALRGDVQSIQKLKSDYIHKF